MQARRRREGPDRQEEGRPGPREGDRALRQDGQDQAQALEEGAGQAAQGAPANPPTPAAADRTAPKLKLAAKRIQRALKAKRLALSARCNERCKLAAVAKVRIGKKKVVLGRAKATAPAGKTVKLKLKLPRKARLKLRRAMKGGKAKVVFAVSAADAAGNKTVASRRVTVKR